MGFHDAPKEDERLKRLTIRDNAMPLRSELGDHYAET